MVEELYDNDIVDENEVVVPQEIVKLDSKYDPAIIGMTTIGCYVYDKDILMDICVDEIGDFDEAMDYLENDLIMNIEEYDTDYRPVILFNLEEDVDIALASNAEIIEVLKEYIDDPDQILAKYVKAIAGISSDDRVIYKASVLAKLGFSPKEVDEKKPITILKD